jgi:nucleoside-diphosphate-sugar epimerase
MLGKNDVVLVTGGTGFTGRYLVRKLCGLGCQVRVIARPSSDLGDLAALNIDWYRGDVFDPALIQRASHNANYIFHVAAAFRETNIADEEYTRVHVDSTRLLAIAALEQPAFKRFVHISTVGVHGHVEQPPADENAPFNTGDVYQRTKLEAELWICDYANRTRLPITVIRPAQIYGPEDRRMLKLFKLASLPLIPAIGFGKGYMHLIHVEDLCDFMLFCADNPATEGEVYICGNRQPRSYQQITRIINRQLGKHSRFIRLPASPFFILGYLCEMACKPLRIEPPIHRRRVAFFTKDRSFDTGKMQATGFAPQFDDETGLENTTRWYRENGWL